MVKRVTLPQRSARPTQRSWVPWQWGQFNEGGGAVAPGGGRFGQKRKGEFCKAVRAGASCCLRRLLPSSPKWRILVKPWGKRWSRKRQARGVGPAAIAPVRREDHHNE